MKKIFILFSIALLSLSLVFPGDMSDDTGETFILAEDSPIFLSFENYRMKDGWTPVVLSVGGLDFMLWLDASDRILERRELEARSFETVCAVDPLDLSLETGANKLYFDVYEQNPVRTRWRLSPSQRGEPGVMTKRIHFQQGGIVLYLGDIRLQLHYVYREFKEISPGLFQVQLHGPMVKGHQRLVYEKAKGIIYSIPLGSDGLISPKRHTWAMKDEGHEAR